VDWTGLYDEPVQLLGGTVSPWLAHTHERVRTIDIRIPKLGMEMTEATLAEWLVDDGTEVRQDQPIYLLETDKVTSEVAAPMAGSIHHVGREGETYPVGEVIAELRETGAGSS
jgi:pyruvate/2-oxoglutarate dehydrogenase complex dihydrolipoamide acyltransferase (E2) component